VILRPGVLEGVRVLAAGPVAARMAELGADLSSRPPDVVVFDGAAAFSAGVEGVRAVLDGGWDAIRGSLSDGQLIVLIAPPPGDAHAEAARAGLENMARTLSIEWARRGIRPVAIAPGEATSPADVAELAAFLASPAGSYYSGCRFDLGRVMG
jgi:NAD(P)-dependent dehydrogenase (short-subunit alcohol dehydrogenase family)